MGCVHAFVHVKTIGTLPRLTYHPIPPPIPKGTHHSKFALLFASGGRGLRVMIATANFIQMDWENKTEASWNRRGLSRVCLYKGVCSVQMETWMADGAID